MLNQSISIANPGGIQLKLICVLLQVITKDLDNSTFTK